MVVNFFNDVPNKIMGWGSFKTTNSLLSEAISSLLEHVKFHDFFS